MSKKLEIRINYNKNDIKQIKKAYLKNKVKIPIFIIIVSILFFVCFLLFSILLYNTLFYYSFIFLGFIILSYFYILKIKYKLTKKLNIFLDNKIYEETIIFENNKLYFITKNKNTEEEYIVHNTDINKIFISIVTNNSTKIYKYNLELENFLNSIYNKIYFR